VTRTDGSTGRLVVLVSLVEAALAPEERAVEVVCIRSGLSKNGNYYAPEVVRGMMPLFEGARAFADHPAPGERPERSVRDLVGYYKAPRIGDDGALRATLKVSKNAAWLWTLIEEALAEGQPDLVGISIDADGRVAPGRVEGRACRVVEGITKLNSCDVVTRASAGGRIERLLQADKGSWWDSYEPANEQGVALQDAAAATGLGIDRLQRPVTGADLSREGAFNAGAPGQAGVGPIQMGPTVAADIPGGRVMAGGTYIVEGQNELSVASGQLAEGRQGEGSRGVLHTPNQPSERRQSDEQVGVGSGAGGASVAGGTMGMRETANAAGTAETAGTTGATGSADVVALREELRQTRRILECERALARTLQGCGLPAPVVRRLEGRYGGRVFEGADLEAAIADERALLAELTDAGLIRGMGYEKQVRVGMNEAERLQKAFDQLFEIYEGERVPALSGIREAYVAATGDGGITGVSALEKLREADVTTATFSYLLGTSMNKRLLKDYQAWPSEWQKFCTVTPIKDFKQQDRIRLGAFGSLSTVPEDTAYTALTLSDTRATYAAAKRGNLVPVTRETIVNDDLYAIRQIPGKLAVAAAFTLAEFVYGILTAAANIYDGNPLFTKGGAHGNSGVTTPGTPNTGAALASAAMQTGVTAMRRQTNLAGKPIGLKPRYLIVPPELEWQGMVVTKSAGAPGVNYNDINPMLGYAEVIVAPQLASATGWYLVCDPRVIDTIEVGFVGGQVNPVLFVQDQPLFGANFTNDVISYKVRHEYGATVVDYRGFYQGNN